MGNGLEDFIVTAKTLNDEVSNTFSDLSKEQLNIKPSSTEWSIAQCFDHLNTTNKLYIADIQKVAEGTHTNNWFSAIPFVSTKFGQLLKKAVSPDSEKKQKAPGLFAPSNSEIDGNIINDYLKNQDKFISLMESSKKLDTSKIKIPSPISNAINLLFDDACEIITLHDRRHFNQAKRVLDFVENLK